MIIGRLIYSGSKLSLSQLKPRSTLWEVCGIEGVGGRRHPLLRDHGPVAGAPRVHSTNPSREALKGRQLVLYDLTSSYFEGRVCRQ